MPTNVMIPVYTRTIWVMKLYAPSVRYYWSNDGLIWAQKHSNKIFCEEIIPKC